MQIVIIVVLVLAAVALVILPLVRTPRGAVAGDVDPSPLRPVDDADELPRRGGTAPPGEPEPAGLPPERPASPSPRIAEPAVPSPESPQPPGEADVEELPQSAPPPPGPGRPMGAEATATAVQAGPAVATSPKPAGSSRATSPVEEEVLRYREALRAGTVCTACSTANPPGSAFCMECGEKLTPA